MDAFIILTAAAVVAALLVFLDRCMDLHDSSMRGGTVDSLRDSLPRRDRIRLGKPTNR